MVDTSKDVLYLTIALCVAIFTFFMSWGLYYIVMMLKKGNDALKEVSSLISFLKEKAERVGRLIDTLEEKITHSPVPSVLRPADCPVFGAEISLESP